MSTAELPTVNEDFPEPVGHVVGFVETEEACNRIVSTLEGSGVAADKIRILHGPVGLESFHKIMSAFQWGEEAQRLQHEGEQELIDGHYVISVKAKERNDGLRIAQQASPLGGHGFAYFGVLVDERMTR